jgi:putative OPT family oligopeptide transporter
MGTNLSPALLGVGYIVGLNIGIVVLSGSIIYGTSRSRSTTRSTSGGPALAQQIATAGAEDAAWAIWGTQIRYMGVGAMLIGGIWTLFSLRKSLLSGVRSGIAAARKGADANIAETDRDLPMKWMLIALVVFVLPLALLYHAIVAADPSVTNPWAIGILMTIIMIIAGFLFVSVSAYLAGLVGSSNNPVSGITIATILFASVVLMLLLGRESPIGAVAAIMIGAVVCCAAAVGGDNLQDLKAVTSSASPVEAAVDARLGAFSCALIMAPVLNLAQGYGIGAPRRGVSNSLSAPQCADGPRKGHVRR